MAGRCKTNLGQVRSESQPLGKDADLALNDSRDDGPGLRASWRMRGERGRVRRLSISTSICRTACVGERLGDRPASIARKRAMSGRRQFADSES